VKTGQIQKRKDNDKKPKDHNIRWLKFKWGKFFTWIQGLYFIERISLLFNPKTTNAILASEKKISMSQDNGIHCFKKW
jgi:hypothetical protein